jgi:hypothetical protein
MLEIGVFDGGYFNSSPQDVIEQTVIAPVNFYASNTGNSRQQWIDKGWITAEDPLGWFQWYIRYHHGRRIEKLDQWQIGRWSSFGARHGAQVRKSGLGDITRRPRQRQGLLHWAHNPEPDV